jgi:hypothetical protein
MKLTSMRNTMQRAAISRPSASEGAPVSATQLDRRRIRESERDQRRKDKALAATDAVLKLPRTRWARPDGGDDACAAWKTARR